MTRVARTIVTSERGESLFFAFIGDKGFIGRMMMDPAAEQTGKGAEKMEPGKATSGDGENNEEDGNEDGGRWRQDTKKLMETPSLQVSINQHKN